MLVGLSAWCQGLPTKHAKPDLQTAKELHFNRTMASKSQLLAKVETSVNTTIVKLTDAKEKVDDAKGELKAKIMDKVVKEVEKWAAVGDKIQQQKAATIRKLTDKAGISHQAAAIKSKLAVGSTVAAARRVTTAAPIGNKNAIPEAVPTVGAVDNVTLLPEGAPALPDIPAN